MTTETEDLCQDLGDGPITCPNCGNRDIMARPTKLQSGKMMKSWTCLQRNNCTFLLLGSCSDDNQQVRERAAGALHLLHFVAICLASAATAGSLRLQILENFKFTNQEIALTRLLRAAV
eukprot:g11558.t1